MKKPTLKQFWSYIYDQATDAATLRGLVFAAFGVWSWKEASGLDHVEIITSAGMFIAGIIGVIAPPAKRMHDRWNRRCAGHDPGDLT